MSHFLNHVWQSDSCMHSTWCSCLQATEKWSINLQAILKSPGWLTGYCVLLLYFTEKIILIIDKKRTNLIQQPEFLWCRIIQKRENKGFWYRGNIKSESIPLINSVHVTHYSTTGWKSQTANTTLFHLIPSFSLGSVRTVQLWFGSTLSSLYANGHFATDFSGAAICGFFSGDGPMLIILSCYELNDKQKVNLKRTKQTYHESSR